MMSLSGSIYVCEQLFSRMKNIKSKVRTWLTGPLGELTPDYFIL
jgi:hypothetical protein